MGCGERKSTSSAKQHQVQSQPVEKAVPDASSGQEQGPISDAAPSTETQNGSTRVDGPAPGNGHASKEVSNTVEPAQKSRAKKSKATPSKSNFSQLQGNWSGAAVLIGMGTVTVTIQLNAKGRGYFLATLSASKKQGPIRVQAWDGKTLKVTAAGRTEAFPATLKGNTLELVLPMVGKTRLKRSKK